MERRRLKKDMKDMNMIIMMLIDYALSTGERWPLPQDYGAGCWGYFAITPNQA